jgi:hypothetical protein
MKDWVKYLLITIGLIVLIAISNQMEEEYESIPGYDTATGR